MFNNWTIYNPDGTIRQENMGEAYAKWAVDTFKNISYAVNPNGVTYPAGLHDDGDYDPAFGD